MNQYYENQVRGNKMGVSILQVENGYVIYERTHPSEISPMWIAKDDIEIHNVLCTMINKYDESVKNSQKED